MEQLTLPQIAANYAFKIDDTSQFNKGQRLGRDEGFKAGAEWQKEQSNWINVNEQLPSLLSYVLVYNTEGATLVARRFENGWWALFADGEHIMGELAPLYWQPLPAPPGKLLQD